jgi:hypothetical protein
MSTNDEPETEIIDEVSTDLEAELREAKADADKLPAEEAENPKEETATDGEEKSDPPLTTEVPSEHDLEWYKTAYEQSTKEALRLKGELDKKAPPVAPVTEVDNPTPEQMYLRTKIAEETQAAFKPYLEQYSQLSNDDSYKEFVAESELLGRVFVEKNKRLPTPSELYSKTVASLGWKPDTSDELGAALKDGAASARTPSAPPTPAPKSKVTDEMIAVNQKMYPNKTRAEIIEELEPHIN